MLCQGNSVLHRGVERSYRTAFSTKAGLLKALILALSMCPAHVLAQSVDECMTAQQEEAISLCKSILDSGSRNSDVYWKLSSAQYQDGQQALANKTLDDALRLHPGNAKLLALREIISSATTEQELLARSAQLNQSSLDKGALKISCLVRTGQEAISACERRLELTDDDGDRIRTRLAELKSQQPRNTVATTPIGFTPAFTPMTESSESPQSAIDPTNSPLANADSPGTTAPTASAEQKSFSETQTGIDPPVTNTDDPGQLASEARRKAYKALVTDVQTRLNELGFSAGYPDGVPGNKTRNALAMFYTAVNAPVSTSITDITLEDISLEQRKLATAEQHLKQSGEAFKQGNSLLAKQKLAEAKASSNLLKVPAGVGQSLPQPQISTIPFDIGTGSQQPITDSGSGSGSESESGILQSTEATSNQTTTSTQNSGSSSQQFTELMDRINLQYGKIRRQEADQEQRLDRIRSAF